MCHPIDIHIDLDALPWPINVLKFNQAIRTIEQGDAMIATIDDADVVDNLQQLLSSLPELDYEVSKRDARYRIRVSRRLTRDIR